MQALQEKPPYVQFEVRAVEDRAKSDETGHWIGKDVMFAIITPAGSKDRIEKVADDWFRDLEVQVRQERFPQNWFDQYKQAFEAFKRNEELPEDGIPIKEWPVCSPSQRTLLLSLNVRTVEQLAELNEAGMQMLGMGARDLKSKAKAFLETAGDHTKVAKKLSNLEQAVEAKDKQIEELMERLTKAETTINALSKSPQTEDA